MIQISRIDEILVWACFQFKFIFPVVLCSILSSYLHLSAWCLSNVTTASLLSPKCWLFSLCSAVFNWTKSGERGQQRSFLIAYLPQLRKGELLKQRGVCSSLVQGWGWCQRNSKGRSTGMENDAAQGRDAHVYLWSQASTKLDQSCIKERSQNCADDRANGMQPHNEYKHSGLNVCTYSTGVPSQTEHWKWCSVIFSNAKGTLNVKVTMT